MLDPSLLSELVIKKVVETAFDVLKKKSFSKNTEKNQNEITGEAIRKHLKYIANWCYYIQFLSFNQNEDLSDNTVELDFYSIPRQIRSKMKENESKDENDILMDQNHYQILGDPGSGKTTTLKRIARKILFEEAEYVEDIRDNDYQFPVLIRLKEIQNYRDINLVIAQQCFGFKIETREFKKFVEKQVTELVQDKIDLNDRAYYKKLHNQDPPKKETKTILEEVIEYEYYIGNVPVDVFISNFLDENRVLLLIDGLDELNTSFSSEFESDIEKLAMSLHSAKIIITCRSGYYTDRPSFLHGFNTAEILPLNPEQVKSIASICLTIPDSFLNELSKVPYSDLANRPLFIAQLLFLYKNTGELPEQPNLIYKKIIALLLKKWDEDNKIMRKSVYSGFEPEKKSLFLSELSFQLTCNFKLKRFSSYDLENLYIQICDNFRLPQNEAAAVASEIETHTGILVKSGYEHYEFSHLSLQEYLCGDYIVRSPLNKRLYNILLNHPEPAAVAIALSSNPSAWFSKLILETTIFRIGEIKINTLLRRLSIEFPYFTTNKDFGYALLFMLLHTADKSDQVSTDKSEQLSIDIFKKFFSFEAVLKSVFLYLESKDLYSILTFGQNNSMIRFILKDPAETNNGVNNKYIFDINMDKLKFIDVIIGASILSYRSNI